MRNGCEFVVNMDRIRMFRYNTNDDGDKDDGVKMMMVILIVIAV